ncbi:MAG: 3-methyl-2-oxobutanoate hydroxymethyltransferase [Candidatus Omnitrophica bacterium]|nr:3-methyl-2-oxobutanoate hydroxymethyltransferase [Candidatus Omnitrophota bacterium]
MAKVSVDDLQGRKRSGQKITMLTAYDCPIAKLLDETGLDIILVGDSLGMVVLGYETTAPVTMEEMLHHARAARRGVTQALLVGDMPLCSFGSSVADSVRDAGRFIREAGCDAVKLEWKEGIEETANAIISGGISVMGHVGLTPQTAAREGGFGMRGKDAESAARIVAQAIALEHAGCFAIVLECIPDLVAQEITRRLSIPTIGIGSGPHCDGQVVVTYDLVGLFDRFTPKFVRRYADVAGAIRQAAADYVRDVQGGRFPGTEETRTMSPGEFARLKKELGAGA